MDLTGDSNAECMRLPSPLPSDASEGEGTNTLVRVLLDNVRIPRWAPEWYKAAPRLEELTLARCGISDLPRLPPTLRVLSLPHNKLKHVNLGAAAASIEALDISFNQISRLAALRDLSVAMSLKLLVLHPNPVTVSGPTGGGGSPRRQSRELGTAESTCTVSPAWRRVKANLRNWLPTLECLDGHPVCSSGASRAEASPSGPPPRYSRQPLTASSDKINPSGLSQRTVGPKSTVLAAAARNPEQRTPSSPRSGSAGRVPRVAILASARVARELSMRSSAKASQLEAHSEGRRKAAARRSTARALAFGRSSHLPDEVLRQAKVAARLAEPKAAPRAPRWIGSGSAHEVGDARDAWLYGRDVEVSTGDILHIAPPVPPLTEEECLAIQVREKAFKGSVTTPHKLRQLAQPASSPRREPHKAPKAPTRQLRKKPGMDSQAVLRQWMAHMSHILTSAGVVAGMVAELLAATGLDETEFEDLLKYAALQAVKLGLLESSQEPEGSVQTKPARLPGIPVHALQGVLPAVRQVHERTAADTSRALSILADLVQQTSPQRVERYLTQLVSLVPLESMAKPHEASGVESEASASPGVDQETESAQGRSAFRRVSGYA